MTAVSCISKGAPHCMGLVNIQKTVNSCIVSILNKFHWVWEVARMATESYPGVQCCPRQIVHLGASLFDHQSGRKTSKLTTSNFWGTEGYSLNAEAHIEPHGNLRCTCSLLRAQSLLLLLLTFTKSDTGEFVQFSCPRSTCLVSYFH